MFISLQELRLRTVPFQVDIAPGEIEYPQELKQTSRLHAEGTAQLLSHSLGEIRIRGTLSVSVEGVCDRCLDTATLPIKREFDLIYMPAEETESASEREVSEAAIDVGYYEGSGLRLNDVLREVVLLALPMQVVCSETCRGICPQCGGNRNQRNCDCHAKAVDDRWSKLKSVKAALGASN